MVKSDALALERSILVNSVPNCTKSKLFIDLHFTKSNISIAFVPSDKELIEI